MSDRIEYGTVYECISCKNRVSYAKLMTYIFFRCPVCGYKIFRKVRAPVIKHLKARY